MPLSNLTKPEQAVVRACLECVVSGKVIKHDWEFWTIMGVSLTELRTVLEAWPDVNESDEMVQVAIQNSMNNLLGYPHGWHERWNEFLEYPREMVARVFAKWRGQVYHLKKRWNETRGDEHSDWGHSWWYFETDQDGWVTRQLEHFDSGVVLKYDVDHVEDAFGGLAEKPLDQDMLEAGTISREAFEQVWTKLERSDLRKLDS
jgi:hypothetical protein